MPGFNTSPALFADDLDVHRCPDSVRKTGDVAQRRGVVAGLCLNIVPDSCGSGRCCMYFGDREGDTDKVMARLWAVLPVTVMLC